MSEQSRKEMDANISSQPADANQSEHLGAEVCEIDHSCSPDSAVSAVSGEDASVPLEASCGPASCSSTANVEAKKELDGDQLSSSEATGQEAAGGAASAAAACDGNSVGFSGVDLETAIARQRELVARVKAEREEFVRRMQQAEAEIKRAAEQMYGAVDNRVNELLAAASELKTERASQLEETTSRMQHTLTSLNQHHRFAEHLLKHGTPAELTRYGPLLHTNAEQLCSQAIPRLPPLSSESEEKLAAMRAFANLNVEGLRQQAGGNLVGRITRTEGVDTSPVDGISPYLGQPRLIAATTEDNAVCGVAFLDAHLFVLRERASVVEVYTISQGLALLRQINVEQMSCPTSIAASTSSGCVFITDAQVLAFSHFNTHTLKLLKL